MADHHISPEDQDALLAPVNRQEPTGGEVDTSTTPTSDTNPPATSTTNPGTIQPDPYYASM